MITGIYYNEGVGENLKKYIELFFVAFVLFVIIGVMFLSYTISRMVRDKDRPFLKFNFAQPRD